MAEPKKKTSNTKRAFIFFNCDANKSEQSMNIFYNNIVYKDTQASRKLLLRSFLRISRQLHLSSVQCKD